MSCPHAVSLGAYLLGALDPADRYDVEQHLGGCSLCQRELMRLAPLPGLLSRVSPADFTDGPSPRQPGSPVLAATPDLAELPDLPDLPGPELPRPGVPPADEPPKLRPAEAADVPSPGRRPWRTRLLVAAAVVVVALLGVGGVLGYQAVVRPAAPSAVAAPVTWTAADSRTGVHATAQLVSHAWGTEVRLQMRDLPATKRCELLVLASDGGKEVAGWWATGYDADSLDVPLATSVDLARIQHMVVVTADHDVLINLQPPQR